MSIQNDAKHFLQLSFEQIFKSNTPTVDVHQVIHENSLDSSKMDLVINYLKSNNYISDIGQSLGMCLPFMFKITARGMDWINDYYPDAQNVQNINFQNNYGSVGNNNTVTVNNYFNFEQFDKDIEKNVPASSPDRGEILELRNRLKLIEDNQIPISQGYLSKFSSTMQKHSWVTTHLAGFLMRWVTNG